MPSSSLRVKKRELTTPCYPYDELFPKKNVTQTEFSLACPIKLTYADWLKKESLLSEFYGKRRLHVSGTNSENITKTSF
jgi:hypothetical protein